jgi:hypothetical protein
MFSRSLQDSVFARALFERRRIGKLQRRRGDPRQREVAAIERARETAIVTDEWPSYRAIGKEFASHDAVVHSKDEYVRREGDKVITTNAVEGYDSIFKRGMKGVYQHCKERHLHRYLAEFDFRYSNRTVSRIGDVARSEHALNGAAGKRLMYKDSLSTSV